MKRLFVFISLFLILYSCNSNYEDFDFITYPEKETTNLKLSPEEAAKIAIEFVNSLPKTRSASFFKDVKSVDILYTNILETRSNTYNNNPKDTIAYIVNMNYDEGFVIVSSNRQRIEILAYVEHGNSSTIKKTGNHGYNYYMSALADYVMFPTTPLEPIDTLPLTPPEFPFTTDSISETIMRTKWGQGEPYNWYCPKENGISCKVGCVATALAQIVAHHKYPSSYKSQQLNWESITEDSIPIYTYDKISLAHFMADIGYSLHTIYGVNISKATNLQAKNCLDSLGYNHSLLDTINFSTCYEDFSNGLPEYIKGQRFVEKIVNGVHTTDTIGHAWVIDGAIVRSQHVPSNMVGSNEIIRTNIQRLVHCNWGEDGDFNGYFNINVLQPIPSDSTRMPYTNVGIIHNIQPNI